MTTESPNSSSRDSDVDNTLRNWAQDVRRATLAGDPPDFSAVPPREPRHRLVVVAAALVVVLVAAGLGAYEWQRDDHRGTAAPARPAAPRGDVTSGNAHYFIVRDGDTVVGRGEVLAVPGRPVRFCAPGIPDDLVLRPHSGPPGCPGVDVTGVDLHLLADRHVHAGIVSGMAELTGTLRNGWLIVASQRAVQPAGPDIFNDFVPCPRPAAGWARNQPSAGAAEHYKREHPGVVVELAYLNPAPQQTLMYLLTSGDPGPVRQALAPAYGRALCVQRSRYSGKQIARARRAVISTMNQSRTFSLYASDSAGGVGLADDAQVSVDVTLPILNEHTARLIDSCAPGLVHVDLWLRPLR